MGSRKPVLERTLDELHDQINELELRKMEHLAELRRLRAENTRLRAELANIRDARDRVYTVEMENKRLRSQLAKANDESIDLRERVRLEADAGWDSVRQCEHLSAELAEARKDVERLDWWLDNQHLKVIRRPGHWWRVWNHESGMLLTDECASRRAAIDAAMEAEGDGDE